MTMWKEWARVLALKMLVAVDIEWRGIGSIGIDPKGVSRGSGR